MKGSDYQMIRDPDLEYGLFVLSIPEKFNKQYLRIKVISGSITNITVDEDDITFRDKDVINTLEDYPTTLYYGSIESGKHYITYDYITSCMIFIKFYINQTEVPVFRFPSFSDIDSDGLTDLKEATSGTNQLKSDTDSDGLIDGYDSSTMSSLELDNSKITEIVIPTNITRDTLVSISVEKFETDYTTKNYMIWKDMDVSVIPMLRIFGNSSIGTSELTSTYGKQIVSYSLTGSSPNYGDGVPDSEDEELEFILIKPSISETSVSYTFLYDVDNSAKDDSELIIRFDFIWSVISHEINSSQIIHVYNVDETIMLQTLTSREINCTNYILASPDSMTENDIFFNLVQNPDLGSFSSFGVSDDVVSSGAANYSEIIEVLSEIRESDSISVDGNGEINETEVVYLSYLFSEYDVLQNITYVLDQSETTELQEKSCKIEFFVSNFITSYISESDISLFSENNIQPDNFKVCYLKKYGNYSEDTSPLEERLDIIDYPIYMNNISFQKADILEVTSVGGSGIPKDSLPTTISSQLHDKISITNITAIENKDQSEDSLLSRIALDILFDIKKVSYCSRILDVPLSDLIFDSYSITFIKLLYFYLSNVPIFKQKWYTPAVADFLPLAWSFEDDVYKQWTFLKDAVPDNIKYFYSYLANFADDQNIFRGTGYIRITFNEIVERAAKEHFRTILAGMNDDMGFIMDTLERMDDWIQNEVDNFFDLLEEFQKPEYFESIYYKTGQNFANEKFIIAQNMVDYFNIDFEKQINHYHQRLQDVNNKIGIAIEDGNYAEYQRLTMERIEINEKYLGYVDLQEAYRTYRFEITSAQLKLQADGKTIDDWRQKLEEKGKETTEKFNQIEARKALRRNVIWTTFDVAVSVFIIYTAILDFKAAEEAKKSGDIQEYEFRFIIGMCKTIMASALLIQTITRNILLISGETLSKVTVKYLNTLTSYCTWATQLFGWYLDLIMYPEFLAKILESDLSLSEKIWMISILTVILAADSVMLILTLLSFTSGIAKWIPFVGLVLDVVLIVLMFVFFPPEGPKSGGVEASNAQITFPELSIKRKAGLTVGDEISFSVDIESTGTETTYIHTRLRAGESAYSDWDGDWDDGYEQYETDTLGVSSTLNAPKSCLEIESHTEIAVDIDGKETIWNEQSKNIIPIPILDADIDDFYDDLQVNPEKENQIDYDDLISEFKRYKETYEHNKVAEIADKLSSKVEHDFLNENVGEKDPTGWYITKTDESEFIGILRPDGTYLDEWDAYPTTDNPHDNVNDVIESPTMSPESDHVISTTASKDIVFEFEELDVGCKKVKELKIFVYGLYYPASGGEEVRVYWRYNTSLDWEPGRDLVFGYDLEWVSFTYDTGDEPNDLDDLQVRFRCTYSNGGAQIEVHIVYVQVLYESSPSVLDSEIVSGYKGHNKIMNLTCLGGYASTRFYSEVYPDSPYEFEFWINKDNYSNFIFESFFQIDRLGSIFTWELDPYHTIDYIRKRPIQAFEWNHIAVRDLVYNSPNYMTYDLYINGVKVGDNIEVSWESRWLGADVSFIIVNDYQWNDLSKGNVSSVLIDAVDYSWSDGFYQWRSFAWDYSLADITYYGDFLDDMDITTGISTDLRENIVEMNLETHEAVFSFDLDLVDPPEDPLIIDIYIEDVPNGFTVNVSQWDQNLEATLNFKFTDTGTLEYAGTYFFILNITSYGIGQIYYESVPFIIPYVNDLDFEYDNVIYETFDIDGNYTSTYDFLGDTGEPDGWTCDGATVVTGETDGHTDVVAITDGSSFPAFMTKSSVYKMNETVEFWVRKDSTEISGNSNSALSIILSTSAGSGVNIIIDRDNNGKILCHYGGEYHEYYSEFKQDTWYHMRVVFRNDPKNYDLYLDGHLLGANIPWDGSSGDTFYWFRFLTDAVSRHGRYYVDAVGASWDSDYKIGDNKYTTDNSMDIGSTKQVAKGDIVNIEFRTNTYGEVQFDFINNDIIQETYTLLSRGNMYHGIQSQSIIIDKSITFDEICFDNIHEYNYFDILRILITDTFSSVGSFFNPVNITNDGNAPEYIFFDIYSTDVYSESFVVEILPGEEIEIDLDIGVPTESIDNTIYRKVDYNQLGSNVMYHYIDNFEIEEIYIVSPTNTTHLIYGNQISCNEDEFQLNIIPEDTLVWSNYSLDGGVNVTFSETANITLPETGGNHTIQVFGANSEEMIFESEIRYFTIQYPIRLYCPTHSQILEDTRNNITLNISTSDYSELSDFEYKLDGKPKIDITEQSTVIEYVPYGTREIIVYGDDNYHGCEYSSGIISFIVGLERHSASQEDDFSYTKGSAIMPYGDLRYIDGNYSTIREASGGCGGPQTIKPNWDITTEWYNPPTGYHFDDIDDMTKGSGDNIMTAVQDNLKKEEFKMTQFTLPSGYKVYKVILWANIWAIGTGYVRTRISWNDGSSWSALKNNHDYLVGSDYGWEWTDLEKGQTDLDQFAVHLYSSGIGSGPPPGCVTVYCVWTEVFYARINMDVQIDMEVDDEHAVDVVELRYSHKTNVSAPIDLDIWDWETSTWDEIESVSNSATFDNDKFALSGKYVNSSLGVRCRYQAYGRPFDYQLEIDKFNLMYLSNATVYNYYDTPIQPDNFTFTYGAFDIYGELDTIDGDYSTIISELEDVPNEFIDTITYTFAISGIGTIPNTYVDDMAFKGITAKHTSVPPDLYYIDITLNFDPALAGRDFYISAHIHSLTVTGRLYINDEIWKTGNDIDFDDELKTGVNSIKFKTPATYQTPHVAFLYYFKIVEDTLPSGGLDFQVDLQIDDEYCYFPNSISYSYRTNISQTVDFDIWDWETEAWVEIESVDNSATFDYDTFWLPYDCNYVSNDFEVRLRFQALECENDFQIDLDQLRLDYYHVE